MQRRNHPVGFSDREEPISRSKLYEKVKDQPGRGVIAHKLVFSLSEDERDRVGVNLQDLVRKVMAARLIEHDDAGHPHVHVVVAGYAEERQVGLYEQEVRSVREWAELEKDRQRMVREAGRPPPRTCGGGRLSESDVPARSSVRDDSPLIT